MTKSELKRLQEVRRTALPKQEHIMLIYRPEFNKQVLVKEKP